MVWATAAGNPPMTGMATTFTCLLFRHEHAVLAQVGDSRAYLLRGRRLRQLTDDHTAVDTRVLASEHDVLVLPSAREALDRIAGGERFDLVLCDLMLPGVTGMAFHERVRSVAPDLLERIVIITGGAEALGSRWPRRSRGAYRRREGFPVVIAGPGAGMFG